MSLTIPAATAAARTDLARQEYTRARIAHWDRVAARTAARRDMSAAYQQRLTRVYQT